MNCHNSKKCACPKKTCPRNGKCCDCVAMHRKLKSLPHCLAVNESKIYIRSAYKNLEEVRNIFLEYSQIPDAEVCFTSFTEELNHLPGVYSLPYGRLYLAYLGSNIAGCIALKPVNDVVCEMKRLYVKPAYRSKGIAKKLLKKILAEGKKQGYQEMILETLPSMTSAINLYESVDFNRLSDSSENSIIRFSKNL